MKHIKIMSNIEGLTIYSNYDVRFAKHRQTLRNYRLKKYALIAFFTISMLAGFLYAAHTDYQLLQAGLIH